MARNQPHSRQRNPIPFPFLGSPAAQSEADALDRAGNNCLEALYAEATSDLLALRRQPRTRSEVECNELKARVVALEQVLSETMTPVSHRLAKRKNEPQQHTVNEQNLSATSTPSAQRITAGAILATSARRGIPSATWDALDLRVQCEHEDHEAFMRALSPERKAWSLLAQRSTQIRKHLQADVKRAIAGPLRIRTFHKEALRAIAEAFEQSSSNRLDQSHSADTAWERRTNTWRPGLDLGPLLAGTEFTQSKHPAIQEAAERLLTMPRLGKILQQELPDSTTGHAALVHGPDGRSYTVDQLATHRVYCDLVRADGLWAMLHSPAMDRLLAQAHHSQPFFGFSDVELHQLAMAQRVASVVIHYAVRDSIHYKFGGWQQTAADVLHARQGSCSGSVNLTVALARAARVPAGAIRMHVEAPGYFGLVAVPNVLGGRNRVSVHYQVGWVTLQSDADTGLAWKLVKSDPADDYELGVAIEDFNAPCSRVTCFNGSDDCILQFAPEYVLDDVGPLAIIDALLRKQKPLMPSVAHRLELLRSMHRRGPVSIEATCQHLALQITQSPCQGRYNAIAQSYDTALECLIKDPATAAVFSDQAARNLRAFLNKASTLEYMINGDLNQRLWVDRFLDFAQSQAMEFIYLPRMADLASRLMDMVQALCCVLESVPESDRRELPSEFVAWKQYQRVMQISTDHAEWARRLGNMYRFMTQCYPADLDSHYGPRASPRWLQKSYQERYLSYIDSKASEELMERPTDSALAFLLGDQVSIYQNDQGQWEGSLSSICNRAGISMEQVQQVASFHEHLLSDVAAATWERYSFFMRHHAEGIRSGPDLAVEFEAWLAIWEPTLARLHRDDLCRDPTYPEAICHYLLPRTVTQTPALIRTALAEFIELFEAQPASMRPRHEAEIDFLLRGFLCAHTRVTMDSLIGERQGGWLKPYGVLYSLWKAYILPVEEAIGIVKRLIDNSQTQSLRSEYDWLGDVAKSYPYQPRDVELKAIPSL
ncbi:hypothetical protein ASPWEDRAFT_184209 [Aspergillus wentii DTO 134E9]|uniref:Transglutaminase-like domain-containing protein n=1 Tax=Aspergillus wentii DTO 134E9 TaxID=1073089 RepID=A0A1L9RFD9_ASPWE|nr:uncharacterized protein ASPWEDRAFT_184209 [Aspergillus wentii DTO 134E9]OJJ33620.1 hypothetical protein ASPWEDRAFT_184209 [Aspergillus wentii DTO 134E9]